MQNINFKTDAFPDVLSKKYIRYLFLLQIIGMLLLPYMVHSQCEIVKNGGFESPVISGNEQNISQNSAGGWGTIANNGNIKYIKNPGESQCIQVAANGASYNVDGIDYYLPSGIYQDFDTSEYAGGVINYGFRYVVFDNHADYLSLKAGPPGGPYTEIVKISSSYNNWQGYNGTYTIPANQTRTRFFFESNRSTYINGGSVNNPNFVQSPGALLDNVSFKATPNKPVVYFDKSNSVCKGNSITMSCSAASGATINWYDSTGTTLLYTGENYTTPALSSDTAYKVQKVLNSSCKSDFSDVTVNVNALPDASISGASKACVKTTLKADAYYRNSINLVKFVWYKDDAVINGEIGSTLVVTSSGNYKLKVISAGINACEQTSTPLAVEIVTDTEKPVITCPANITQTTDAGKCTANVTIVNPTATDNCSTVFTFTGVRSDALALTAAYPVGKTTISWTAKDDFGNVSASCDQTITITDTEKPVITCADNMNQEADFGKCTSNVTITKPTATDNCSTVFTFTGIRSDALAVTDTYPLGTTTISWTAKDDAGNVSTSCDQTITITDTKKPVITCPANITQTADAGKCTANVTITNPTATDNCSTAVTFTGTRSDALALTAAYPLGKTTISWTAKDDSGNVSTSCDQTITIADTEKPVITCAANITQTADTGKNNANVTITNPTATDNCSTTFTFTGTRSDALALAAAYPVGKTTISWTAKDDAGNVSTSCDQTIIVTDRDVCDVKTIKASFEEPSIKGIPAKYQSANQSQVPGWKTTASDGMIDILATGFENVSAVEGSQFVELNGNVVGGLYQDFDISEGVSSFSYSFAHRGRYGTDTMVLKAGPPGGPYTEVTRASTGNMAWQVYTGTYTIPVSQKKTRFLFESVSSSGGSPTDGNLLDAIHFTAILVAPSVTGADKSICEGSSATLKASAIAGATVNWYDAAGTTLLYTGPNYTTPALSSETTYKVEQVTSTGCKSAKSDIKVTVFDKITVSLSGASKACSTTTLTATTNIRANVTNNSVTVNDPGFVWYKDDAVINGETKETLVVTASGNYKLKVTSDKGCEQTSDPIAVEIVTDTEKPVITCAANISQTADTGKNNANVTITNPTATDNCSTTFTFTGTRSDGLALTADYPMGKTTISWTAKDESGNVSAPCDQIITITKDCTVNTINPSFESPVITDGANRTTTIFNQSLVPGWKTTAPDGNIEIWNRRTVGVNQESKNLAPYDGNQFAELNANYVASLYQDFDTSEVSVFNYSVAHRGRFGTDVMVLKAGPPGGPYTEVTRASTANTAWKLYTGTYTIPASQKKTRFLFESVSSAGSSSSAGNFLDAIHFTAVLAAPPVTGADKGVCKGSSATLKASAIAGATVNWYDAAGTTLLYTGPNYTTPALSSETTYKVEQVTSSGCKSAESDIKVTVNDLPNASISGTSKACSKTTLEADAYKGVSIISGATFVWYKDDAVINGENGTTLVVTVSGKYKLKVTNHHGCESTSDPIDVVIGDTEKPVITCSANISQTADAGKCTANVTITNPTATDNCSTAFTFTGVRSDALALTAAYPMGKTTISWTAKDDAGNVSTSCDQTITITDTEKPVITCAANISQTADAGKCTANVTVTNPTATDNCSTAVTFTGVRSDALALTAAYPLGKTTISWTAKDDSGNVSDSCDQTITISDSEKPVITCAANISQTADAGKCTANVTITNPTATDNCSTAVTFTGVRSDALALTAAYPVGKTTISWTAKDDAGNVSDSCDQTITISDTEKPVITCAANISQTADAGKCTANVTITNPTATDNCSTAVTFTGVRSDALALTAAYPLGKTTISWTAKDDAGNVSTSCDQTITISDSEKPVITCAANISQTADAGKCTANVMITNPTATDNCSTAVTFTGVRSDALALTAAYPLGKTTISWTAKDDSGNVSASCDQTITITDTEKPVITCAANITQTADAGKNNANVTITNPTATDNCSTAVTFTGVRSDALALTAAYTIGKTTITWTAKDDAGNVSTSCDQTITITDTEKPVITCATDVATKADDGLCTATIALIAPTVNDNSAAVAVTNNAPVAFPVGVTTVVWTATDNSGNKATCEQKVTVYSLIKATDDAVASVNGAVGGSVVNVLDNDVLNCGVAKANELKIALASKALPSGIDFDTATGAVSVKPNTPAGTYTFDYTICNLLNSSICGTATVKIDVVAPKIEIPVTTPTVVVDPKTGTTPPITSDIKINDQPVTIGTKPGDVTVTIIKAPPGFILNPDGTVTVPPNTPGGIYTVDYKVCQVTNPTNCVTGSVKVEVVAPKIEIPVTTPTVVVDPKTGTTPPITSDIKINDQPVTIGTKPGDVTVTIIKAPPGFILNPDGTVTVPPNTPGGTYTVDYKVCQVTNPANCVTGSVKVTVDAPKIEIPVTTPTVVVDPKTGTTPPITSDIKINDQPVTIGTKPGDVTVTIIKAPPGFILNPDGTVTVPPNTPGGTYTVDYKVCQVSNPANCVTGSVKVTVDAPKIETPVTTPTVVVDPKTGTTPPITSDIKINDQPVTIGTKPGDVTVTIIKAPPGFILNPDGTVTVPPNTPGGTYTIDYKVCQVSNPANCVTGSVKVTVDAPKIETPVTTPTVVVDPKTGTTPSLVTDVKINNQPVTIGTNPGDVTIIITKAPPGFILNPDGTVTVPPNTPGGIYTVDYQICQVGNPKNCITGSVKIEVGGPTDACVIKVSNAVSPNGDSENDRFYIHGLECYPDNTVEIYNRWGRLVYECKHYNNVDRVFRGGNDELVGTYYYVIRYTDDKSRTHEKVGYLYIGK